MYLFRRAISVSQGGRREGGREYGGFEAPP